MADEKLKAFRWLGPGVLHIRKSGGEVVVVPPSGKPSIVRQPENLEALGATKIDELVKAGSAEYFSVVDGIIEMLAPPHGSMSGEELAEAQQIASESLAKSDALHQQAQPQVGADGKLLHRDDLGVRVR